MYIGEGYFWGAGKKGDFGGPKKGAENRGENRPDFGLTEKKGVAYLFNLCH